MKKGIDSLFIGRMASGCLAEKLYGLEERHPCFEQGQEYREANREPKAALQTGLLLILHLFFEIGAELS